MQDDTRYVISGSKVTLSPSAIEDAKKQGMSLAQMARHLRQQDKLKRSGLAQRDGEN